jgi:hypothetical protein
MLRMKGLEGSTAQHAMRSKWRSSFGVRAYQMSSATWYSQLIGDEKSRVCFHKLSLSIVAEYVPGFIVATAP